MSNCKISFLEQRRHVETMWHDVIEKHYPGGHFVNISPHHRVVRHGNKAIKIQHGGASSAIERSQSVQAEYEILNKLNGAAGPLEPHLKTLRPDWVALELNWINGRLLADILHDPNSPKPSLLQLVRTAYRIARRGITYSQFRGRHIIVQPSGEMAFIDFGGSRTSSPLRTLVQMFTPLKRCDDGWKASQLWYLAKKILEHGRTKLDSRTDPAPTLAHWSFAEQVTDVSFDPAADEAQHLFSAETDIKRALARNPNVAHDIPTAFMGPFYIRGSEQWELLWHTVTRTVHPCDRDVIVLHAGIGLAATFAEADGAANVIACEKNSTLRRAAIRIGHAFGVRNPAFVSALPIRDIRPDLVISLSRCISQQTQRGDLRRFSAANDMVIRTTLEDVEIKDILTHGRTFAVLRQDGNWRLLHIRNHQTGSGR